MNKNINIPGRLHSVATDGQVAGANEIYDDEQQKFQGEINAELHEEMEDTKEVVDSFDNRVKAIEDLAEISIEGGEVQVANTAEEIVAGSGKVPTANAVAPLKENILLGAVYDVSAKNPTAGPNNDGKWESLSALLSDANLNTLIPTSVRKGGMSIKFVQSSDNKYVQVRYMGTSTVAADFTNTANWQGVDDEPTAGSENLVKSRGVYSSINRLDGIINGANNYIVGFYFDTNGSLVADANYAYSDYIDLSSEVGNTVYFWHGGASNGNVIAYDENKNFLDYYSNTSNEHRSIVVPNNCVYVRFCFLKDYSAEVKQGTNVLWEKGSIVGLKDTKLDVVEVQSLSDTEKQTALINLGLPTSIDTYPTNNSNNLVLSKGVYSGIQNVYDDVEIEGKLLLKKTISASAGTISLFSKTQYFGTKIGFRIIRNNATLASGSDIVIYIYNNGTSFSSMRPNSNGEWTFWDSTQTIDEIYIQTTGGVSSGGEIAIEVAYGEYYEIVKWNKNVDLGEISLVAGTAITKWIDPEIFFDKVSNIEVHISDFESTEEHPYVFIYAVYSSNRQEIVRLRSIVSSGDVIKVSANSYEKLYGFYFWNNLSSDVSFNATVVVKSIEEGVHSIVSYDNMLNLPSYYNSYIKKRQTLLRSMIKDTIIDGDVFYFMTDSHWEFNQRNSPAILKKLNDKLNIPRLFHGGDMYHDGIQEDKFNTGNLNLLRSALGSDKVYMTDGNHEYIHALATYGDVFAESRIFLDDVVFGGDNKNYYYVDNTQKKIRYINLYSYGEYVNGSITHGLTDTAQQNWFKDVALNVESGWSIFIFSHTICDLSLPNLTLVDGPGASEIYSIINNYSGNGKILAFLIGHTHLDDVVLNKCACPIVITTCDHNFPFKVSIGNNQYYYDLSDLVEPRVSGTVTEQAFDTVIFDKDNMLLNFVRIGSRAMNRSNSYVGNAQVDIRTVFINSISVGTSITLSTPYSITSWESSDTSVATVSNGTITANASGYVVITGTSANGDKQSWFIKIV